MTNIGGEFYFNTKSAEKSKKITTDRNMTIMSYTPSKHIDAGEVQTKNGTLAQSTRVTDGGSILSNRAEFSIGDYQGSSIFNEITKLDGNGDNLTVKDLKNVTQSWLRSKFGKAVRLINSFDEKTGAIEIEYNSFAGNPKRIYINAQMNNEDENMQAEQVQAKKDSNAEAIATRTQQNIAQKLHEKFGDKYSIVVEQRTNPYEAPKTLRLKLSENITLGQIRADLGILEKVISKANPQLDLKKMSGVSNFEVGFLRKDRNYDNIQLNAGIEINVPIANIHL